MSTKSFFVNFSLLSICCLALFGFFVATEERAARPLPVAGENQIKQNIAQNYGDLPLSFERNVGQTDKAVDFIARGKGYGLFLSGSEAVLKLQKRESAAVLRMRLKGANPAPHVVGQNELEAKSNYFVGNDPDKWIADVPQFSGVRYEQVYPGVDQVFYGTGRELEYDFIIAPEIDHRQIAIDFPGVQDLEINASGELVLTVGEEKVVQRKPVAYQDIDGERREVSATYSIQNPKSKIQNRTVGFELADYDRTKPLTIDPVLVYSTYLGGTGADSGRSIAIDDERNVYVTGSTTSANFPTANALQPNNAGFGDVFVTKINPAGTAILYSTYMGGSAGEIGYGIDIDAARNVYVTGVTGATLGANNFPTTPGAFDPTFNSPDESFLFKLNAAGNALVYSTYTGAMIGFEVKVDKTTGEAFISGNAGAVLATTPGSFMPTCPCAASNAFVSKFNASGTGLIYSTYIGPGPANDLAIDASGNSYITGSTTSSSFPITPGAVQPTCTGCNLGRSDAFVTKLNAAGSALAYSTYLGGSVDEVGRGITVDAGGNAYVTGRTESSSAVSVPFPTTPGAFQATSQGTPDGFVTKLNPTGTAFVYSTYVGGNVRDEAFGIAVGPLGSAHIIGQTRSTNFPLVIPFQSICPQNGDCVFMASLNPAGSALVFSTFFGQGQGTEVAADNVGNIYVTGITYQGLANLPTMNPIQASHGAGDSVFDGFVAKIEVEQIQPNRTPFDFDGDGSADVSVYRPSEGIWYILQGNGGYASHRWGISTDRIMPGDYDGDGRTDLAVFRKGENSTWYILESATNTYRAVQWGASNIEQPILFDTPVPADYDGDGRTDLAVWRLTDDIGEPARFLILQSSNGAARVQQWGTSSDRPVPADFDGDDKADLAVYRSGDWWWVGSSNGQVSVVQFGLASDRTVPADYDGDGKADYAVFRDGTWYIQQSLSGFTQFSWGISTDVPVPADYDGDGKTDAAIFRDGVWWLRRSQAGVQTVSFGLAGDKPIPAAFLQ